MIEWTDILLRLGLASLLGATVGLERERIEQVAGMRTHMMVCLGSALITLVSMYGFLEMVNYAPTMRYDPTRIAAQIVSGIGFLGAGTILFLREKVVRGLTTAAGLWTVGGIGIAVGCGAYFAAVVATVLAIVILLLIHPFEKTVLARIKPKHIKVIVDSREESTAVISGLMKDKHLLITSFTFDKMEEGDYMMTLRVEKLNPQRLEAIVTRLQTAPGVKEITWES